MRAGRRRRPWSPRCLPEKCQRRHRSRRDRRPRRWTGRRCRWSPARSCRSRSLVGQPKRCRPRRRRRPHRRQNRWMPATLGRERQADGEAAHTATAAHRLGQHAVCEIRATGVDVAGINDFDVAGNARRAAAAAAHGGVGVGLQRYRPRRPRSRRYRRRRQPTGRRCRWRVSPAVAICPVLVTRHRVLPLPAGAAVAADLVGHGGAVGREGSSPTAKPPLPPPPPTDWAKNAVRARAARDHRITRRSSDWGQLVRRDGDSVCVVAGAARCRPRPACSTAPLKERRLPPPRSRRCRRRRPPIGRRCRWPGCRWSALFRCSCHVDRAGATPPLPPAFPP